MPAHKAGAGFPCPRINALLSESESLDQCTITVNVLLSEISKKAASVTDHLQKTSVGMKILRILLHMLCEGSDVGCQKRYLNFR